MARTATVFSASLSQDEKALTDELTARLAGGSSTELMRILLRTAGLPLLNQLQSLIDAGVDPSESLVLRFATRADTVEQGRALYQSSWPENGQPRSP